MSKSLPGWLGPAIGALIALAIGIGVILYVHSQDGENQLEPGEKPAATAQHKS